RNEIVARHEFARVHDTNDGVRLAAPIQAARHSGGIGGAQHDVAGHGPSGTSRGLQSVFRKPAVTAAGPVCVVDEALTAVSTLAPALFDILFSAQRRLSERRISRSR